MSTTAARADGARLARSMSTADAPSSSTLFRTSSIRNAPADWESARFRASPSARSIFGV